MIQSYNIELEIETYIGSDGLLKFQVDKNIHKAIQNYLEENYDNNDDITQEIRDYDAELLKTNGKVY
jgi:hypothetical protein